MLLGAASTDEHRPLEDRAIFRQVFCFCTLPKSNSLIMADSFVPIMVTSDSCVVACQPSPRLDEPHACAVSARRYVRMSFLLYTSGSGLSVSVRCESYLRDA